MTRTPTTICSALNPLPVYLAAAGCRSLMARIFRFEIGKSLCILPVTFGHVLVLDKLGINWQASVLAQEDVWPLAFVLSRPHRESVMFLAEGKAAFDNAVLGFFEATVKRFTLDVEGVLAVAIKGQLVAMADSFRAHATPNRPVRVCEDEAFGLGWLLSSISQLSEIPAITAFAPSVLDLPVATGFALMTARDIREGDDWEEASYVGAERMDREAEERTELKELAEKDSK